MQRPVLSQLYGDGGRAFPSPGVDDWDQTSVPVKNTFQLEFLRAKYVYLNWRAENPYPTAGRLPKTVACR